MAHYVRRREAIVPIDSMNDHNTQTDYALYTHTAAVWDVMYDDCLRVQRSLFYEQYILLNDDGGRRFLTLFRDKARAGIRVHIVVDGVGSRALQGDPLVAEIRAAGGRFEFVNPLRWWHIFAPKKWLPRNHCKTLIIDDDIAYIGGVCIAAHMAEWRDMHMRISGPMAQYIKPSQEARDQPVENSDGPYQFITSVSKHEPHAIYRRLLDEIDKAQDSVRLVTPYFFPPRRLRKALARAAMRGVDVQIMVSEKIDLPFGSSLSRSYFPALIMRGIDIMVYSGRILHAKYAIIDGRWATLGSSNFDYLSLVHNYEANLIITDPEQITAIQAAFDDMAGDTHPAGTHHPFMLRLLKPLVRIIRRKL